ncbi:MAG: lysophospholipase [Lachnospiraceae bacterium]|nr:lysophospholipase [Lachnospiraceae bacterium]
MKRMKKEAFTCRRGELTIRGVLYHPQQPAETGSGGKYPAAILSHGFMANYRSMEKYARMFARMGFAAVAYDFCGGGLAVRSDGRTEDMSVLTEKEDLKAVIAAVSDLPFVNPEDITLVGGSQGGFVSAMTAQDLQDKIRRLILFFPALCIPDDARAGKMLMAEFDPEHIPDIVRCGPMKLGKRYVEDVIGMNAFEQIREYRGPVLILHGSRDDIVKPSYSVEAYRNYRRMRGGDPSEDCQLVMISGGNHGFFGRGSRAWDDYTEFAIRKFLEGKRLLLNVDVKLTNAEEEKIDGGRKVKLFFEGHSSGAWFRGDVVTPAFDEQIFYGKEPETCCADYVLAGKDFRGNACTVHVRNKMAPGKNRNWARDWKPEVSTDSEALSFVNGLRCETYAEGRKMGPFIHIWG